MKYHEIVEHVREQLSSGRLNAGDRVPSENQLARRFSVSRPTAARALRELEGEGLVERRAGSGTYVTERPVARRSRDAVLGLLVPGLGATEVLDPICTEITRVGQEHGAEVLWGDSISAPDPIAEVDARCLRFIERGVDGVFFAPHESVDDPQRENRRTIAALLDAGVHVVLLDRESERFPARSPLDLVGMDNLHAGMALGAHLVGLGHRRFVFLARPQHPSTTDLRAAGCRVALERAGIEVSAGWQLAGDPEDASFARDVIERSTPDVIVCSNDLTAAMLMATLARLGISVPDDVAIAAFDDVRYSTLLPVPLTTIRMPCRAIGREAVRVMLDRLEGDTVEPRQVLLTGELIVRRSCGAGEQPHR